MIKKINPILRIFLFLIAAVAIMASCSKDDPDAIAARDREKILDYIAKNNLEAQEHSSGIFYVIRTEGSGGHPRENSTVKLTYTGYLLNGDIFDYAQEANMNLSSVIMGFRDGIMQFKRGGEGLILIPSGLGYGEYARHNIPRNSVLIFEVEIIDFN